jgi:hypothetical protein
MEHGAHGETLPSTIFSKNFGYNTPELLRTGADQLPRHLTSKIPAWDHQEPHIAGPRSTRLVAAIGP